MRKKNGKRPAQVVQGPSKRRKLAPETLKSSAKKKENAFERDIIPVPISTNEDDIELSEQDLEVLDAYGGGAAFLGELDQKGISRSRKETDRLHSLNKPIRKAPIDDDLPSIDSHDEDEAWSSGIDDDSASSPDDEGNLSSDGSECYESRKDSDAEMSYEAAPRKRRPSWDSQETHVVHHLPIKLADGRIQKTGSKAIPLTMRTKDLEDESDEETEDPDQLEKNEGHKVEDVSTGARFGRPAVIDVIGNKSRKARIQGAKDQIAGICQEIVAEPENSLGLLRRLHTFSLPVLSTPTRPAPVTNDIIVRKLAILSQLAVFKDIIPGYRIRSLTDKEKLEKVSQMVARTREWEQGLVVVYQSYLRSLEAELKAKSELADIALQCMCTLAAEVTHFNFRINIMGCIVARLSKKSWDKSSDLCLNTLIKVFRSDLTGTPSLEAVRLLNRMIKEKRFLVNPSVLSCLLHLRLKAELGTRASESKADKENTKTHSKGKAGARRAKGKHTAQPHLSKKTKKALKEKKEIEKEFREAEAEVDKEERAVTQTETLKLLFVLYFQILKNPESTPLLPAALQGISKYAHLVNVDFFKDLLKVLKGLISRDSDDVGEDDRDTPNIQLRLQCIVTAFELLSGQGEALNIDLSEFVNRLYAIILPLSLMADIEKPPPSPDHGQSVIEMLFCALNIVFSPRTVGSAAPSWRSAAFAKRLLTASLHWPPEAVLRVLDFVGGLVAKDAKLEALLCTEDRTCGGMYRADIDDPQLCNPFGTSFWELHMLYRHHWHAGVRSEAEKLAHFIRS